MEASELRLEELIDFKSGWIGLKGRRLVIFDTNAVSQLRKDLMLSVGPVNARRIITRFGFFWGHADAAAMKRIFKWDCHEEWLKASVQLISIQGVARVELKDLKFDVASGSMNMNVVWRQSTEAEDQLEQTTASDEPVCWMLTAYFSGYASFCMNHEIYFVERKCRAAGSRICTAEGLDRAAWGNEIQPFLTYYESSDIWGKIRNLTRELKQKEKELAAQRKRMVLFDPTSRPNLAGVKSAAFRRVLDMAMRVARFDSSILITGESGVGKEVLARLIHKHSPRSEGPFLAVNCGALPDTLLESELFGHVVGAFTGAVRNRVGLFEEARKGTIFLDEIGDISPAMQVKLLRVLQEKEILRLGDSQPRKVDVRIIAATNKNLIEEVQAEQYREDLYYRLRVIEIEVPPLRERQEDILPLARFFVKRISKTLGIPELRLDPTIIDYLQQYHWPGNVRELENALEHAAVMSTDGIILPEYLPAAIREGYKASSSHHDINRSLQEVQRDHIRAVLEACEGNRTLAAQRLGIGTATLWRKLKEMAISGV